MTESTEGLVKIIGAIAAAIAAIVAGGFVYKSRRNSQDTKTKQVANTVGGDQAGRDISKS
jgi:hypothetical protein